MIHNTEGLTIICFMCKSTARSVGGIVQRREGVGLDTWEGRFVWHQAGGVGGWVQ